MANTYETYKDSGIAWLGEIPSEWKVCQFKRVHTGTNVGESIDKEFWSENIDDKVFYTAGLNPIHTSYSEFPEAKYTNSNDLLLARNGTPYVYLPENGSIYTDHIIRVSIKEQYNRSFLRYAISQSISFEIVDTVSIATWSASLWNEQLLPIPTVKEQQSIATFLNKKCGEIDSLIALQEEMISELQAYKQSVITEAVTKGLNPNAKMKDSGVEWIGEIPENWNVCKLKAFIRSISSGCSVNAEITPAIGGEYGVLKTSCVSKNYFIPSENKKVYLNEYDRVKCPVKGDTILVSRMNTPELVGAAAYCDKDINNIFLPDRIWQVDFIKYAICVKYAWYYLISTNTKHYYSSLSAGTSSSMQNISQSQFENAYIVYPCKDEQHQIASYLDAKTQQIDSLITLKQEKIQELKDYKKSIIYEYVTGKKRV